MGYKQRAMQDGADNHFGIPEGLVKKRREELILARISALLAAEQQEAEQPLPAEEITTKQAIKLAHLTQSRPIPHHRLPTRYSRQMQGVGTLFSDESRTHKQVEPVDVAQEAMSDIRLIEQLKGAITAGICRYKNRPENAAQGRHEPGWFTNWRHGADGVKRAESLHKEINKCRTMELVLIELTLFFLDDKRRYENNSLSMYLLDALNALLNEHSYPGSRPEGDAPYDKFTWINISAQLNRLKNDCMAVAGHTMSFS